MREAGELRGKVALVTGSTGKGMGRSIALTLAREGAKVVLNFGTGRPGNQRKAGELIGIIRKMGSEAVAIKADVRAPMQVKGMVREAAKRFRGVHILVLNHSGGWDVNQDLATMDPKRWQRTVDAELDGTFNCLRYVLPLMRKQRWGRVISLSWNALWTWRNPPYDYTVGKAGAQRLLYMLVRSEWKHGITVNSIAPGYLKGFTLKEALEAVKNQTSHVRRTRSTPQDVGEVAAFLCSDQGRFLTGGTIALADNKLP